MALHSPQLGRGRSKLALAALLAVVVLVLSTGAFGGGSRGGREAAARSGVLYGFHQNLHYWGDDWRTAHIAAMKGVGAEISRSVVRWRVVQPKAGAWDWHRIDSIVHELAAEKVAPLFVLAGSPAWANGSADEWHVPEDPKAFRRWSREYVAFARAAAARYQGRVRYWEIWNEPNENLTWRPDPSPRRYGRLFTQARAAIAEEDPSAEVAVGGITGLNVSCCVAGISFIRHLIEAGVQFDRLAIHPYARFGQSPDEHFEYENNFSDVELVRDLLRDHGLAHVKLWLTEWGWSSKTLGEQGQAEYLARALERIRYEWSSFVELSTTFLDVDTPDYRGYGALHSDLSIKPAGEAFRRFIKSGGGIDDVRRVKPG